MFVLKHQTVLAQQRNRSNSQANNIDTEWGETCIEHDLLKFVHEILHNFTTK